MARKAPQKQAKQATRKPLAKVRGRKPKLPPRPPPPGGPPDGYWRAPVHGYQWPAPEAADGAVLRGALRDIDTAAPLGDVRGASPALVVLTDDPVYAWDVEANAVVRRERHEAVRVCDPAFAKFARLLSPPPAQEMAHVIITLRRTAHGARYVVDVATAPVLASDYEAAGSPVLPPTTAAHS